MHGVRFTNATYLGGFRNTRSHTGTATFNADTVTVSLLGRATLTVQVAQLTGIKVEAEHAVKSRAAKVAVLGAGGLGSKATQTNTLLTLYSTSGEAGVFRIPNTAPADARAHLATWAATAELPWVTNHGPTASHPKPPAAPTITEQLADLAAMHAAGELTNDEYAAAKRRILGEQP